VRTEVIAELMKGAALLLALCMLQSLNMRGWRGHPLAEKVSSGLLFGGVCVLGMALSMELEPGVIFDARSVVLSMAGLFGGPLVAGLAVLFSGAYRFWMGGAGVWVGLGVITSCAALGLAYRWGCQRGWLKINVPQLLGFGFLVHLVVVLFFAHLPGEIAEEVLSKVAWPMVLVFTPTTVCLGLLLQNIADFFATETALGQSEARLRAMVNAMPDLLFVLDQDGRYLEILSTESHLLYEHSSQLIGKLMHEVLPQADADRFLGVIHLTLATQQPQRLEYALPTRQGLREFEGRTQPLDLTVNGVSAVLFLARDITADKTQQDAMMNLLQVTADQNQRLKNFTYIVSHQIRSQVANLLGLVELSETQNETEKAKFWQLVGSSAQKLDEVIHDLNEVIGIQNEAQLETRSLGLRTQIEAVLKQIAPLLAESQGQVSNQVPAELEVQVIPVYLQNILLNLLSNAIRYRSPERRLQIQLTASQHGKQVSFTIQDNGLGLDLARHGHKLFGIYQTFHGNTDAKGLGLFITKAQVEAMQGHLDVQSELGIGSSFRIYFPEALETQAV